MGLSAALVISGWVYASATVLSKETTAQGMMIGILIAIGLTIIGIIVN